MEFNELMQFIEEEDLRLIKFYGKKLPTDKRILARTVKLSEEVGELSNEILTYLSLQRKEKLSKNKDKLAKEMVDILLVVLLIAKSTDVNIEKVLDEKISEIRKRNY